MFADREWEKNLMRIQSWLLLVVTMGGGIAFAFLVGLVWYPLNPVVVTKEVPQSRVLVSKRDIPVGTVLFADSIQYDFVPNDRIPVGATNDFFRIYSRRTLHPISQGTPICDLDLEGTYTNTSANNGSLPSGMNLVRVQIDRVQGTPISNILPRLMTGEFSVDFLADSLQPNDLVDLMLLETSQRLADGNGAFHIRKPPKLVASGVRVHSAVEIPSKKVASKASDATSDEYPSLILLMSQEQVNLAKTAAKEGWLQIHTHRVVEKNIAQAASPIMADPAVKILDSTDPLEIETSVIPKLSSSLPPGEIQTAAGILPVVEKVVTQEKSKTPAPEKPRPQVIDIGLGAYRKSAASTVRPSESPSNAVEFSTRKSSGAAPAVEIYSFAPKNRKKTDLFPKYFYGITELNQESNPVAAL